MKWRRSPKPDLAPLAAASPIGGASLDDAAYAAGVADANAGVPDPLAESNEGRQPVARLEVYGANARATVERTASHALAGLNEVERLKLAIDRRIEVADEETAVAEQKLISLPPGEHRLLADWRVTVMLLAIALALPFEVYLTALSLDFLDIDEVGRRLVTLGVALSVALSGLLVGHLERRRIGEETLHGGRPRPTGLAGGIRNAFRQISIQGALQAVALILLLGLIAGLALLRYDAIGRSTIWEGLGSLTVLGIVAAVFALWIAFVHRRLQLAETINANWIRQRRAERLFAGLRAQVQLLHERRDGLAAEVAEHGHHGATALRETVRNFDAVAFSWWTGYQSTNRTASPDIRDHAEAIRQKIELDVSASTQEIESRVLELRRWLDTGAPPLPPMQCESVTP